jgi:hypothetical protein
MARDWAGAWGQTPQFNTTARTNTLAGSTIMFNTTLNVFSWRMTKRLRLVDLWRRTLMSPSPRCFHSPSAKRNNLQRLHGFHAAETIKNDAHNEEQRGNRAMPSNNHVKPGRKHLALQNMPKPQD